MRTWSNWSLNLENENDDLGDSRLPSGLTVTAGSGPFSPYHFTVEVKCSEKNVITNGSSKFTFTCFRLVWLVHLRDVAEE